MFHNPGKRKGKCFQINNWIVDCISTFTPGAQNSLKSKCVQVLTRLSDVGEDGSIVKQVADGSVFIAAIFTAQALAQFAQEDEESTPQDWDHSKIIIKSHQLEHKLHTSKEKCEFILRVDSFDLLMSEEGLRPKVHFDSCMDIPSVRNKSDLLWQCWEKEHNKSCTSPEEMDELPLSALIYQMELPTQESQDQLHESESIMESQNDELCADTNNVSISSDPGDIVDPVPLGNECFDVDMFIISDAQKAQLEAIREWQPDYRPSEEEQTSSSSKHEPTPSPKNFKDVLIESTLHSQSTPKRSIKSSRQQRISIDTSLEVDTHVNIGDKQQNSAAVNTSWHITPSQQSSRASPPTSQKQSLKRKSASSVMKDSDLNHESGKISVSVPNGHHETGSKRSNVVEKECSVQVGESLLKHSNSNGSNAESQLNSFENKVIEIVKKYLSKQKSGKPFDVVKENKEVNRKGEEQELTSGALKTNVLENSEEVNTRDKEIENSVVASIIEMSQTPDPFVVNSMNSIAQSVLESHTQSGSDQNDCEKTILQRIADNKDDDASWIHDLLVRVREEIEKEFEERDSFNETVEEASPENANNVSSETTNNNSPDIVIGTPAEITHAISSGTLAAAQEIAKDSASDFAPEIVNVFSIKSVKDISPDFESSDESVYEEAIDEAINNVQSTQADDVGNPMPDFPISPVHSQIRTNDVYVDNGCRLFEQDAVQNSKNIGSRNNTSKGFVVSPEVVNTNPEINIYTCHNVALSSGENQVSQDAQRQYFSSGETANRDSPKSRKLSESFSSDKSDSGSSRRSFSPTLYHLLTQKGYDSNSHTRSSPRINKQLFENKDDFLIGSPVKSQIRRTSSDAIKKERVSNAVLHNHEKAKQDKCVTIERKSVEYGKTDDTDIDFLTSGTKVIENDKKKYKLNSKSAETSDEDFLTVTPGKSKSKGRNGGKRSHTSSAKIINNTPKSRPNKTFQEKVKSLKNRPGPKCMKNRPLVLLEQLNIPESEVQNALSKYKINDSRVESNKMKNTLTEQLNTTPTVKPKLAADSTPVRSSKRFQRGTLHSTSTRSVRSTKRAGKKFIESDSDTTTQTESDTEDSSQNSEISEQSKCEEKNSNPHKSDVASVKETKAVTRRPTRSTKLLALKRLKESPGRSTATNTDTDTDAKNARKSSVRKRGRIASTWSPGDGTQSESEDTSDEWVEGTPVKGKKKIYDKAPLKNNTPLRNKRNKNPASEQKLEYDPSSNKMRIISSVKKSTADVNVMFTNTSVAKKQRGKRKLFKDAMLMPMAEVEEIDGGSKKQTGKRKLLRKEVSLPTVDETTEKEKKEKKNGRSPISKHEKVIEKKTTRQSSMSKQLIEENETEKKTTPLSSVSKQLFEENEIEKRTTRQSPVLRQPKEIEHDIENIQNNDAPSISVDENDATIDEKNTEKKKKASPSTPQKSASASKSETIQHMMAPVGPDIISAPDNGTLQNGVSSNAESAKQGKKTYTVHNSPVTENQSNESQTYTEKSAKTPQSESSGERTGKFNVKSNKMLSPVYSNRDSRSRTIVVTSPTKQTVNRLSVELPCKLSCKNVDNKPSPVSKASSNSSSSANGNRPSAKSPTTSARKSLFLDGDISPQNIILSPTPPKHTPRESVINTETVRITKTLRECDTSKEATSDINTQSNTKVSPKRRKSGRLTQNRMNESVSPVMSQSDHSNVNEVQGKEDPLRRKSSSFYALQSKQTSTKHKRVGALNEEENSNRRLSLPLEKAKLHKTYLIENVDRRKSLPLKSVNTRDKLSNSTPDYIRRQTRQSSSNSKPLSSQSTNNIDEPSKIIPEQEQTRQSGSPSEIQATCGIRENTTGRPCFGSPPDLRAKRAKYTKLCNQKLVDLPDTYDKVCDSSTNTKQIRNTDSQNPSSVLSKLTSTNSKSAAVSDSIPRKDSITSPSENNNSKNPASSVSMEITDSQFEMSGVNRLTISTPFNSLTAAQACRNSRSLSATDTDSPTTQKSSASAAVQAGKDSRSHSATPGTCALKTPRSSKNIVAQLQSVMTQCYTVEQEAMMSFTLSKKAWGAAMSCLTKNC